MTSTTLILFIKICKCRSFCQTFGLDVKQNQMRSSITRSGTKYQNNYITTSIFLGYTYDKNKNVIDCTTYYLLSLFQNKNVPNYGIFDIFSFLGAFFSDKNQQIYEGISGIMVLFLVRAHLIYEPWNLYNPHKLDMTVHRFPRGSLN